MLAAWALLATAGALVLLRLWTVARRREAQLSAQVHGEAQSLERLQLAFSRFAPSEVVEEIIASGMASRAESREVTILFADIKGSTDISERVDPAVLVELLNGWFRAMNSAINENNGHIAKFIGDGLMALFGVPQPNPWQASDAVKAALAMRRELAAYNQTLRASGRPELSMGVGIARGVVVAGVIGTRDLQEYTVIGAAVNLASRIETLARQLDVDILVSESVQKALGGRFPLREMPELLVKGVSHPVRTYAVE